MLDEYRRSFSGAYEFVVVRVRSELGLEPTGRPAKSTTSIAEKLERESIRLAQIQDIAGCRLVVPDVREQERVTEALINLFENVSVIDRREQPSHGYRAVHVIARFDDKLVEIQVRTSLQHIWAELSEKVSDVVDPSIKYGGGMEPLRKLLSTWSSIVKSEEDTELQLADTERRVEILLAKGTLPAEGQAELAELRADVAMALANQESRRVANFSVMRDMIEGISKLKRRE
jgi:ppGpp synthetase/RelA/SpoT-type nucleotidyltranferase